MSGIKSRTLWIVGILAVLVLAFVAVLPIGAARLLEGMLRDRGATEVSIEDVDINLFAGTLAFYRVEAANDTGRLQVDTLEVDAALWSIVSSRVEILDLKLMGGHLDLIQGQDGVWQLGSLRLDAGAEPLEPVDTEPTPPWGLGAHRLSVQDFMLTLQSDQLTREFELQRLVVDRAFSWQPQDSLSLELSLRSGEAELDLTAVATPFDEVLSISGDFGLSNLLVHNIQNPTLAAALERLAGTINTELDFNVRLEPGSVLDLELEGDFSLAEAVFADQGAQVGLGEVEWRGTTTARIDLSENSAPASLAVTGEVNLADLQVSDSGDDFVLLALGGLGVQDLNVTELQTTIAGLTLTDLQAHVQRQADGALRLPGSLATSSDEAEVQTQETPAEIAYVVRIDELLLVGDSQIHVRDEAVDPVFIADLSIDELRLSEIDTSGSQPLSINLLANSSETDSMQVAGTVEPFIEQLSADLEIDLEGFDLSRFSSYVPGYNLERGRMALQISSKVVDGELDIQNKITIDKLKIAGKTDDEDALMATGAAMPLDVMLDLLRDSDDRIELEIPVTGSLDSFDVGINQVIRKATQAALQKAAMAYVKTALQPLGTILFAANLAGKAARPRFEPVQFAAGSLVPTGENAEYTNKIAELLKKRPSLGLTLCGVATKQDEIALTPVPDPTAAPSEEPTEQPAQAAPTEPVPAVTEETLLALAKARADAVKDGLISRGVDAKQLFDCRASFETAEDELPRVEVML